MVSHPARRRDVRTGSQFLALPRNRLRFQMRRIKNPMRCRTYWVLFVMRILKLSVGDFLGEDFMLVMSVEGRLR